jgi:hypothetical protein
MPKPLTRKRVRNPFMPLILDDIDDGPPYGDGDLPNRRVSSIASYLATFTGQSTHTIERELCDAYAARPVLED